MIPGRHSPDASWHRIGHRRILTCRRSGNAGSYAGREQAGQHVLGIVADQEAVPDQLVHGQHDLGLVDAEGSITLPDRRPRISPARRRCLRERDELAGSLASVVGPDTRSQTPTRVGCERHQQFRQANAGNVVAVRVGRRHVARINLAV